MPVWSAASVEPDEAPTANRRHETAIDEVFVLPIAWRELDERRAA